MCTLPAKTEAMMRLTFHEHSGRCEIAFGDKGHWIIKLLLIASYCPALVSASTVGHYDGMHTIDW